MKLLQIATAGLLAAAASVTAAHARDQIQIAGSSTVLPYAKIVAETFGETFPDFKIPVVESGGSGVPGGARDSSPVPGTRTRVGRRVKRVPPEREGGPALGEAPRVTGAEPP